MTFRAQPILITILSSALAGVIAVLVIVPTLREIRNLNNRIHMHRRALELLYQQGQDMRSSLEEFETIQSEIPLVKSSVLDLGNELAFITALEDIAARHHVQQVIHLDTSQRSPLATQKQMPFHRVLLRLDVQGTAAQLQGMWRDLETLPAYLNITTISLSSNLKNVPWYALPDPSVPAAQPLSGYMIAATYWRESPSPYTYEDTPKKN